MSLIDALIGRIEQLWSSAVTLSKNADWPMALGVFFVILVMGLAVALYVRYTSRDRLLARTPEDHFTYRHLPVAYLSSRTGRIEDMLLTPSQFIVFGTLNNEVMKRKHGMCTDQPSWSHFCLLAAAEAYQRVSGVRGQFSKGHNPDDTLNFVIDSSIQDLAKPYAMFLFRSKTNVPHQLVTASLESAEYKARGVLGLGPVPDLPSKNISIVSI